jgi:hypothetical protein
VDSRLGGNDPESLPWVRIEECLKVGIEVGEPELVLWPAVAVAETVESPLNVVTNESDRRGSRLDWEGELCAPAWSPLREWLACCAVLECPGEEKVECVRGEQLL